jgi:hypothetical protein
MLEVYARDDRRQPCIENANQLTESTNALLSDVFAGLPLPNTLHITMAPAIC